MPRGNRCPAPPSCSPKAFRIRTVSPRPIRSRPVPDGTASVTWTLGKNAGNTTVPMSVVASLAACRLRFSSPSRRLRAPSTASGATSRRSCRSTPRARRSALPSAIWRACAIRSGCRCTIPSDSSGVQGVAVTWAPLTSTESDGHTVNATTVTDNKGFAKTLWVLLGDAGRRDSAFEHREAHDRHREHGAGGVPGAGDAGRDLQRCPGSDLGDDDGRYNAVSVSATVKDCNGFPVPGASVVTFATAGGNVSSTQVYFERVRSWRPRRGRWETASASRR